MRVMNPWRNRSGFGSWPTLGVCLLLVCGAGAQETDLNFGVSEPRIRGSENVLNVGRSLDIRGWYAAADETDVQVHVNGDSYATEPTYRDDVDERFPDYPYRSGWAVSVPRSRLRATNQVVVLVNGTVKWEKQIALAQRPASRPTVARARPTFRVLYSNDTTNLEYLSSPYRKTGERFRPAFLKASVDEAVGAGADAMILQPGTGWVPWWKSNVYSPQVHYQRRQQQFDIPLSGIAQYLADGGDIVDIFVDHCRKRGAYPFVSIPLNDIQGIEFADANESALKKFLAKQPYFRFRTELTSNEYVEHPEYRFDAKSKHMQDQLWNWVHPEVRAHKLALVKELAERYDVEGIELDFMRFPRFFDTSATTWAERRDIMNDFVRDVRDVLDASASEGRRRWLVVRVPAQLRALGDLGLEVAGLAEAGVDMFNLSSFYFTNQDHDVALYRDLLPNHVGVYLEMTHATSTSVGSRISKYSDDRVAVKPTTLAQFYTTARQAYAEGADGVSLFNFAYFRPRDGDDGQAGSEPPFAAIEKVARRGFLDDESRNYFLGSTFKHGVVHRQLPARLRPGLVTDISLPGPVFEEGNEQGLVRVHFSVAVAPGEVAARLNGRELINGEQHGPESIEWTCSEGAGPSGLFQLELRLEGVAERPLRVTDVEIRYVGAKEKADVTVAPPTDQDAEPVTAP